MTNLPGPIGAGSDRLAQRTAVPEPEAALARRARDRPSSADSGPSRCQSFFRLAPIPVVKRIVRNRHHRAGRHPLNGGAFYGDATLGHSQRARGMVCSRLSTHV
jgi:hypothetical protein